jgi:hypothetical protein
MATHSLVTMPVVSHSQKRKKCAGSACNSSARCACARCRKMVTEAMVMWVTASVNSSTCHQAACSRPSASQSTTAASWIVISQFHRGILVGAGTDAPGQRL